MEYRSINNQELKLLEILITKSGFDFGNQWKKNIVVKPLNDGGMGSLELFPDGNVNLKRVFGKQISEYFFQDVDGVKVIASLNIDSSGNLYELDLWKTDFSPLQKINCLPHL